MQVGPAGVYTENMEATLTISFNTPAGHPAIVNVTRADIQETLRVLLLGRCTINFIRA